MPKGLSKHVLMTHPVFGDHLKRRDQLSSLSPLWTRADKKKPAKPSDAPTPTTAGAKPETSKED
ncbi:hypothetical protein [Streptomyces sp.]|uniref:hypothetical protein n=1 Tax=Streptomyces sp. TaxID=1931 RepID=UPI002F952F6F